MDKFSQNFSKEDIMNLAKSPAGQQLIAMLRQTDNTKLEQAVSQAKTGDYAQAGETLRHILSTPEAQRLMKELGGK